MPVSAGGVAKRVACSFWNQALITQYGACWSMSAVVSAAASSSAGVQSCFSVNSGATAM